MPAGGVDAVSAAEIADDPAAEDMPIHQQLFRTQEEPCIMPLPPEDLNETASAGAAETDEEAVPAETNPDPVPEENRISEAHEEPAAEKELPEEGAEPKE